MRPDPLRFMTKRSFGATIIGLEHPRAPVANARRLVKPSVEELREMRQELRAWVRWVDENRAAR